jgi:hypothetical protein
MTPESDSNNEIEVGASSSGLPTYTGTWDALRAAGHVPSDWAAPPEDGRKRGSWWLNAEGRRCKVARIPDPPHGWLYRVGVCAKCGGRRQTSALQLKMLDPDRLFAVPIINYIGMYSSINQCGGALNEWRRLPSAERWKRVQMLEETEPGNDIAKQMAEAMSELEAFEVVERARRV